MRIKEQLHSVVELLSEERLRQLLDFALYLQSAEEREGWQQFGRAQLARAYGPDEPDYSEEDVKPKWPS